MLCLIICLHNCKKPRFRAEGFCCAAQKPAHPCQAGLWNRPTYIPYKGFCDIKIKMNPVNNFFTISYETRLQPGQAPIRPQAKPRFLSREPMRFVFSRSSGLHDIPQRGFTHVFLVGVLRATNYKHMHSLSNIFVSGQTPIWHRRRANWCCMERSCENIHFNRWTRLNSSIFRILKRARAKKKFSGIGSIRLHSSGGHWTTHPFESTLCIFS